MKAPWLPGLLLMLAATVSARAETVNPAAFNSNSGRSSGAPLRELSLRYDFKFSDEVLSTDRALLVDPGLRNPHRQRWALLREVDLAGLRSVPLPDGRFGVTAEGLVANLRAYVRPPGEWYRSWKEFPCQADPDDRFATEEGARFAAGEAGRFWKELISARKLKLEIFLKQVTASTPNIAFLMAEHLFRNWRTELEDFWVQTGQARVRELEKKLYQLASREKGHCTKKMNIPGWERMLEPVPPLPDRKLLARAPARRWEGMFSVRLTLLSGMTSLVGQFLIDSGARKSLLSPQWLESQGIPPHRLEVPAGQPEKVTWAGGLAWGSKLANPARAEEVQIGGSRLSLTDFLLFDADFFGPPETAASCCDGVLGVDFLSRYVVELDPGPPTEVRIWRPEGFAPPSGEFEWTEVHVTETGETSSDCWIVGSPVSQRLGPVLWDTGSAAAIKVIRRQWRSEFRQVSLECGGKKFESGLSTRPWDPDSEAETGSRVSLGMGMMGRGKIIFDLPHGKIWIAKSAMTEPLRSNRTGLELEYRFVKGERVLQVKSMGKEAGLSELKRAGLKVGTTLTRIDGKSAEDLDLWEVRRRLAGQFGDMVTLEWSARDVLKLAPLKVRY